MGSLFVFKELCRLTFILVHGKNIEKRKEHIGLDKRINVENGENAKDASDFNRVWRG